jgi:hypothetical protein
MPHLVLQRIENSVDAGKDMESVIKEVSVLLCHLVHTSLQIKQNFRCHLIGVDLELQPVLQVGGSGQVEDVTAHQLLIWRLHVNPHYGGRQPHSVLAPLNPQRCAGRISTQIRSYSAERTQMQMPS